jgi:hypothetical protein
LEVAGNLFVRNQELQQEVVNWKEFSIIKFEEFKREKEELEKKRQECIDEVAKICQEAWFAEIKVLDLERQVNKKENEIGHLREIEQSNQTLHERVQRLIFDKSQLETTLVRVHAERTDWMKRVDRLRNRVDDLEGLLSAANIENTRLQEYLRQQREEDGVMSFLINFSFLFLFLFIITLNVNKVSINFSKFSLNFLGHWSENSFWSTVLLINLSNLIYLFAMSCKSFLILFYYIYRIHLLPIVIQF